MGESRWMVLWWSRHGTGWQPGGDHGETDVYNTEAEAAEWMRRKQAAYDANPRFWNAGPWAYVRIDLPSPPSEGECLRYSMAWVADDDVSVQADASAPPDAD